VNRPNMSIAQPVQYGHLRAGPEAALQRCVESSLHSLFPQRDRLVWTAGSVPLGAGRPDIVLTACAPQIVALTDVDLKEHALLAYLRAVGRARPDTISARLGRSLKAVKRSLSSLVEANIIIFDRGNYALSDGWRSILPEIITIEVKVDDWRRALAQASRNRIFAHRSFIALPEKTAERIKPQGVFRGLGIGILAVGSEGDVRVVRRARRAMPKVWSYYYSLASMAAAHFNGDECAVQRADRKRKGAVS
jgi:hypothetical protein